MNDKASQKTEEEVLDQTFGGFDEEMTAQTVDPTHTATAEPGAVKAKPGSSNTMLLVGGGIACILVLGYMLVLKPRMNAQNNQVAQQPVAQQVAQNTPPVVQPPVAQASTPDNSPQSQAAAQFLSGQNSGSSPSVSASAPDNVGAAVSTPMATANTPEVTASAPVVTTTASVNPVTQETAVKTTIAPVASASSSVATKVSSDNAVPAATVGELSNLFESQTKQFKMAIDDVDNRVQGLESFRDEQKNINKNVDERLVKLENGKHVAVAESGEKPVVKHHVVKTVAKTVKPADSNVLVDNTEVVTKTTKVTKQQQDTSDLEQYNIHSIFGNRVWLKNADGSLSTYAAGDRLPSGELIKSVNDDKFSVTTDKRVLVKK